MIYKQKKNKFRKESSYVQDGKIILNQKFR
jgi:hypothetical protein